MALTVGDREIRPLTADEVLRMVDAGILGDDEPVELLHGVLTKVSPKSPEHSAVVVRLTTWLAPLMVAGTHDVRVEQPMRVPDPTYLPEPDIAVVTRPSVRSDHPRSALLVVEVAVTSKGTDLRDKAEHYGAAGVPEYWVVDLPGRTVERFTDPVAGGFATRTSHRPTEKLRPLAVEVKPLDLAGLFAQLGGS